MDFQGFDGGVIFFIFFIFGHVIGVSRAGPIYIYMSALFYTLHTQFECSIFDIRYSIHLLIYIYLGQEEYK